MTPHMYSFPLWQQLETEKSSVGEISAFTMLSIAINNKIIINRYLHPSSFYIAKGIFHASKVTSAYVFNWLWRKFETKICYAFAYEYDVVVLVKYLRYYLLKLRHYEKATKFEKISHHFWQNSCSYSVASKQVGDFFEFLWPFQKSWTLTK